MTPFTPLDFRGAMTQVLILNWGSTPLTSTLIVWPWLGKPAERRIAKRWHSYPIWPLHRYVERITYSIRIDWLKWDEMNHHMRKLQVIHWKTVHLWYPVVLNWSAAVSTPTMPSWLRPVEMARRVHWVHRLFTRNDLEWLGKLAT